MSDWGPLVWVALAGAVLLLAGWLAIVAMRPGPRRVVVEWLAATAMFLALGAWFVHLLLDARAEGRTALLIPFGFLAFTFCAGFCVSVYKTVAQLLGRSGAGQSATH